jgi:hypothetical protein
VLLFFQVVFSTVGADMQPVGPRREEIFINNIQVGASRVLITMD